MKQSQLFPKTLRENPKDEISANSKLLVRACFVDKLMAGVYTFLPLGFRVLKKIENIIRQEMTSAGGQEILMSVLQPKENWQKTGRWDSLDSLFKFVSHYSKTEFALGPTHEEIISPLVAKFSLSYKNLPLYLFQIQTKLRDEKRTKSGILRGREFIMKDFYSFHADEKDMEDYYKKMKVHYKNIFDKCDIGGKTYITFASGGSFSKYSHEYQTITKAGEDRIYVCDECKIAINAEIIDEQKQCPECGNKDLKEQKAIEVGNIFPLKTKYSKPFGLKYKDKNGFPKDVIMGCYGLGLGRLMGAIVEINHDEKGIIWPEAIAPFKVHLISLGKNEEADKIYNDLSGKGVEVLYDDREDATAGEKFADADLIGLPYRLVVSEKTVAEEKIELKKRKSDESKLINKKDLLKILNNQN
ncbi:prolyl-tRNA synthetase [Patescibacteria group bacterium]|nr:prolyl-tRNA synthetase [Patescibacteria group bacterium]